jgi:putative phosphoribosyl transferase
MLLHGIWKEVKIVEKFKNRTHAGKLLAAHLTAYANHPNLLILGLPRGGVPVAFEVAKALHAPLDIFLVRKLGVPYRQELAMGAIAPGDVMAIDEDIVKWLGISKQTITTVADREKRELDRRDRLYRGDRPTPQIRDRTVILVDDGIATGSTLRAAIAAIKPQQPHEIIVAIPVAPPIVYQKLQAEVDEVACVLLPKSLSAIGQWYEDFSQTTDEEVRRLLAQANNLLAAN